MNKKTFCLRSILCILIALFMLLTSIGCVEEKPIDKENNSSLSSDNSKDIISNIDDTNSENSDIVDSTSEEEKVDNLNRPTYSVDQDSDTTAVNSEKTEPTTSTITTEIKTTVQKSDFVFDIEYHPGMPGYDVKYNCEATFKGKRLNNDDYTVTANLEGVYTENGKIVVPAKVNEAGGLLVLTAVYNDDKHYKSQITVQLKAWEQTWADEFDVDGDLSNWSLFYMDEHTEYENASVENGYLKLESKLVDGDLLYTDVDVSSRNSFTQTYGCFTAKMKVPKLSYTDDGIMTAFWLIPPSYTKGYFFKTRLQSSFEGCSEIDIVETCKIINGSSHTEHYWNQEGKLVSSNGKNSNSEVDAMFPKFYEEDAWVEYTCVWTKNGIYYYVNGNLAAYNTSIEPVSDPQPAYIILSIYSSYPGYPQWYGELDSVDQVAQELLVDYVRVYK